MIWSSSFICTSVCNKHGGQRSMLGIYQLLFTLLFRQSLSLNPKLIIWLDWLANELRGPTCPYFFSTGITDVCFHTQMFLGCGGSESRSSCLQSKLFPYWRSYQSLNSPYLLMGYDKICIIIEVYGSLWLSTPGRPAGWGSVALFHLSSPELSPPTGHESPEIYYLDLPNVKVLHTESLPWF